MPSKSRTTPVRRRVWNLGRLFVLLVALGATFAVFFLTAMRVTSRARDVEVPNLYGKSIEEARVLLAGRGLTVRIDDARRPDKAVPPDHVLTQEPAAGQIVRRQRAIRVRLSDGMRAAALPVVTEFPERTAEITSRVTGLPSATRPRSTAWTTSRVSSSRRTRRRASGRSP